MWMRSAAIVLATTVFCAQAAWAETDAAPPPDLDCDAVIGSDMNFQFENEVERWFQDLAYCHDTFEQVAKYLETRGFIARAVMYPEEHFRHGLATIHTSWSYNRHKTTTPFGFWFKAKTFSRRRGFAIGAHYDVESQKLIRFPINFPIL